MCRATWSGNRTWAEDHPRWRGTTCPLPTSAATWPESLPDSAFPFSCAPPLRKRSQPPYSQGKRKEHFAQGRSALRGTTLVGRAPASDSQAARHSAARQSAGGDEGIRTPCLLNAIEALSQMSYIPTQKPLPTHWRVNARRASMATPPTGVSPRRLAGEFGLAGAPSVAPLPGSHLFLTWLSARYGLLLLITALEATGSVVYCLVELRGFEPLASSVRLRRSPK